MNRETLRWGAWLRENLEVFSQIWIDEFGLANRPMSPELSIHDETRRSRLYPPDGYELGPQYDVDEPDGDVSSLGELSVADDSA